MKFEWIIFVIYNTKMSVKSKDKNQESSSSKTIHIIAWIAPMILILGSNTPTYLVYHSDIG
jgi:heme/copper-type cytochrome/quinol oxidase subunit 2